jgi:hypothetical protein
VVELLEKLQKTSNLPAAKVVALQKVLQSDFFNAVREVYEHIYETIDGSNDPELRASATAKVCPVFYLNSFSVKTVFLCCKKRKL